MWAAHSWVLVFDPLGQSLFLGMFRSLVLGVVNATVGLTSTTFVTVFNVLLLFFTPVFDFLDRH